MDKIQIVDIDKVSHGRHGRSKQPRYKYSTQGTKNVNRADKAKIADKSWKISTEQTTEDVDKTKNKTNKNL